MALLKVIQEEYENKGYDTEHNHARISNRPAQKVLDNLKSYSHSHEPHNNLLDIPSIPGGKVYVLETITHKSSIRDVKVSFYYLENANKEDIEEVRNIIKESGLSKIISK